LAEMIRDSEKLQKLGCTQVVHRVHNEQGRS